jgi:hypothetical protein
MSEATPELSYENFVRARKLHRKQEAKSLGSDAVLADFDKIEIGENDSNFILYSPGPGGVLAVFEDDNETGWLYLYDTAQRTILRSAHVYNRADVAVAEDEVDIGWAADESVCGLAVWGQFRAFLGISNALEMRKPVVSDDEQGICAQDWPPGFEHYLEKKLD